METVRFARLTFVDQSRQMLFAPLAAEMFRVIRLVAHTDTLPIEDRHLARVTKQTHALVVVLLAVGLPVLAREEPEETKRLWALGALEAALMPRLVHSVDTGFTTLDRLATAGAGGVEHICVVLLAVGIVVITFTDLGTIAKVFEANLAAKMCGMPCHPKSTEDVAVYDGFVTRCTNFHCLFFIIYLFVCF